MKKSETHHQYIIAYSNNNRIISVELKIGAWTHTEFQDNRIADLIDYDYREKTVWLPK